MEDTQDKSAARVKAFRAFLSRLGQTIKYEDLVCGEGMRVLALGGSNERLKALEKILAESTVQAEAEFANVIKLACEDTFEAKRREQIKEQQEALAGEQARFRQADAHGIPNAKPSGA